MKQFKWRNQVSLYSHLDISLWTFCILKYLTIIINILRSLYRRRNWNILNANDPQSDFWCCLNHNHTIFVRWSEEDWPPDQPGFLLSCTHFIINVLYTVIESKRINAELISTEYDYFYYCLFRAFFEFCNNLFCIKRYIIKVAWLDIIRLLIIILIIKLIVLYYIIIFYSYYHQFMVFQFPPFTLLFF